MWPFRRGSVPAWPSSPKALRDLLEAREAEIRRLHRVIDLYKQAEQQKEAEARKALDRLRRLQAAICRGEYVRGQLSGGARDPFAAYGFLELCDYIERNVQEEYGRLQAQIADLRRRLDEIQARVGRPDGATAAAAALEQPREQPRPVAQAALPDAFAPDLSAGPGPQGRAGMLESGPPTGSLRRLVDGLEPEERDAVLAVAKTGLNRTDRLGGTERGRQLAAAKGLLAITTLPWLPGRPPAELAVLTDLGRELARALGAEPVPQEVDLWQRAFGDLAQGYALAQVADAWSGDGWQSTMDPVMTQVVVDPQRVVAPHLVARSADGGFRYVWLYLREPDPSTLRERLAEAAAITQDLYLVGGSQAVCRLLREVFTEVALADVGLRSRGVVAWIAPFDQALTHGFRPASSGQVASRRLKGAAGAAAD